MTHPIILWLLVLACWITTLYPTFNYISLIFTIMSAGIAFAYTMFYQIVRK